MNQVASGLPALCGAAVAVAGGWHELFPAAPADPFPPRPSIWPHLAHGACAGRLQRFGEQNRCLAELSLSLDVSQVLWLLILLRALTGGAAQTSQT